MDTNEKIKIVGTNIQEKANLSVFMTAYSRPERKCWPLMKR